MIRIVADTVSGSGALRATGGNTYNSAKAGRIRIEANSFTLSYAGLPAASIGLPANPVQVFPPERSPAVRLVSLAQRSISDDPRNQMGFTNTDLVLNEPSSAILVVEAKNVPLSWKIKVFTNPEKGNVIETMATLAGGDATLSTWNATLTLPAGVSSIQVRAYP